ncbi:hypothetical protein DAKH74_022690 [Maudiozyma humilis]|uniref:Uncharacterized protein n=1 Tax=Maudiozyma humilis TaxID=51915 RepID=A0AAV5RW28_MAUHU|nr:hypothetical protein DAKH74_022690 [Kazachstania humilis]
MMTVEHPVERCPSCNRKRGIRVSGSEEQPSACLCKDDYKEDEEEKSRQLKDESPDIADAATITDATQSAASSANEIIGGANMDTHSAKGKAPERRSTHDSSITATSGDFDDSGVEFNKPRFITIEDLNDLDTKEMKEYKHYNRDHKIFSFSLPFGRNNREHKNEVEMFNLIAPLTEEKGVRRTASQVRRQTDKSFLPSPLAMLNQSSNDSDTSNSEILSVPAEVPLRRSKTVQILDQETPRVKSEIKQKLEKTNSISSLEELELYKDEKGIENVRNKAIKESIGIEAVKHQIKQITIDDSARTPDGYTYGRMNSIWNEIDGDFVIMGGYRGSILRDATTRKRVWVPLKAGLNLTKIDLYIGPTEQDEIDAQKKIIPDGMLTHVGPVDISRKLIKRLDANPKVHIETFGYDWRLSLEIPCEQLTQRLRELYEKQKTDPRFNGKPKGTYILAHSMGGLIAHKVLKDHPELVRGIVYIGAPNQCPNILGPIRFGDTVMWNKSILSSEANFFMRSSHYFLPLDGRCFINKDTYERYDFDFFDPEIWRYLGLSPLVSQKRVEYIEKEEKKKTHRHKKVASRTSSMASIFSLDPPSPMTVIENVNSTVKDVVQNVPKLGKELVNNLTDTMDEVIIDYKFRTSYEDSYDYLTRTLAKAKKFKESLDYDPTQEYPPLVTVYGNRVPTVRGCKVAGIPGIINGEYDDFYYGAGDGVVHHSWALPGVRGFPVVAKIVSETGHVSLMTDFESMSKALISLYDADKERWSGKQSSKK